MPGVKFTRFLVMTGIFEANNFFIDKNERMCYNLYGEWLLLPFAAPIGFGRGRSQGA